MDACNPYLYAFAHAASHDDQSVGSLVGGDDAGPNVQTHQLTLAVDHGDLVDFVGMHDMQHGFTADFNGRDQWFGIDHLFDRRVQC